MGFIEILMLAVGLSMDAFAVSICKGLSVGKIKVKYMIICGIWFGFFQALMPLIGYYIGSVFKGAIESADHWIAFGLLLIIGINMIRESLGEKSDCEGVDINFSFREMFFLAVATSIDALAVGVSLAMAGSVNIYFDVTVIGVTTFVISSFGVLVGSIFGSKYEKGSELAGGIILILIGIRILVSHLFGL